MVTKVRHRAYELVKVGSLAPRDAFEMPWRDEGKNIGEVIDIGVGSATVNIPRAEGDGWERTNWSLDANVIPCSRDRLRTQDLVGTGTADNRVRSTTEKPVETVHRICAELHAQGKGRKEILEACIKAGVNPNTAKTQYYHWRKNK